MGADNHSDQESSSDDDGSDDSGDPNWEPPQRRRRPLRPWHMAETTGRIGQVVLLRAQHGYRRPPGVTMERLLRDASEVTWVPGLGDAARPAAARLRQALLGWTRTEPVPASEASSHATCRLGDRRQTRERSWRGEWRRRPSRLHAPPWEVEDGPTGDAQQAIAGFKERLDRRVTKVRGGCLTM